ncbi:phage/plasmid primase, P4 family [Mammaliicoccus vitulinus]|uniref:phage/plasmid primase, P4 family n=1 Tax=Mammaliicoccus vitulinus TaxID=71237 RepID=UPI00248B01E2|nr:phage/plasmid primase, P4 family [Mammaliicoccus vitulinus]
MNELKKKYNNIPYELKNLKRWVCFKTEGIENDKISKRPYNPMTGKLAKVNDDLTWSTFDIALSGCVKYKCDGIGFILGHGIFGVDIDNHKLPNGEFVLSQEDFERLKQDFLDTLSSYSEVSPSGKGVHIICKGKLPNCSKHKGCIELYGEGSFLAFTGNSLNDSPLWFREEEIKTLCDKYITENIYIPKFSNKQFSNPSYRQDIKLSDDDVINLVMSSKNGETFYKYYHDGDISMDNNNPYNADMNFCKILVLYCGNDKAQIDRIFRNSALMRDKWDELENDKTYGENIIDSAINENKDLYLSHINNIKPIFSEQDNYVLDEKEPKDLVINGCKMNLDEFGEPIIRIKQIYKKYPYNDTGNAYRFYDYFGDLFKYNVTDKAFMYWTGKTWIKDYGDTIIRKYANKLIDILITEENNLMEEIENYTKSGDTIKASLLQEVLKVCKKNTSRLSNKPGKDAMIFEFWHLYDIKVESKVFDPDEFLLNTDSGIIDLTTGKLLPWDKLRYMSKNTNVKVSYDEPKEWLKFLHSVFDTGDEQQTQEIINSMQTCLGYSLTGSTREQVMFMLLGNGSNGKTTLVETISEILGDYSDTIKSDILMSQKGNTNSDTFSLAKLQKKRMVVTGETDENGRLAEAKVKSLTGEDKISAAYKFGNEFDYYPEYKLWMCTNNKPIIRGQDFGIWRRIFLFVFTNLFDKKSKDIYLKDKLAKEYPQILGWMIQGALLYKEKGLIESESSRVEKTDYKLKMDNVAQFIESECIISPSSCTNAKLLYSVYKDWARDNTDFILKEQRFAESVISKGYIKKIDEKKRTFYIGIKLPRADIGA